MEYTCEQYFLSLQGDIYPAASIDNVVSSSISPIHPTTTATSSAEMSTIGGTIAAGVIDSIACLSIIGIVYWFYFHRRRYRVRAVNLLDPIDNMHPPAPLTEDRDKPTLNSASLPLPPPPVHVMLSVAEPYPPVVLGSPSSCVPELGLESNPPSRLRVVNPNPYPARQLCSARQVELLKQLAILKKEIGELTEDLTASHGGSATGNCLYPTGTPGATSISSATKPSHQSTAEPELRAQIQVLIEQIIFLQAQLSSAGDQRLTRETLSDYSPRATTLSNLLPVLDTKSKP
jgi:hypothetical protein